MSNATSFFGKTLKDQLKKPEPTVLTFYHKEIVKGIFEPNPVVFSEHHL